MSLRLMLIDRQPYMYICDETSLRLSDLYTWDDVACNDIIQTSATAARQGLL